jgi:hypothetical protein
MLSNSVDLLFLKVILIKWWNTGNFTQKRYPKTVLSGKISICDQIRLLRRRFAEKEVIVRK